MTVLVEPDAIAMRIREYARQNPDLRNDRYNGRDGSVDGMCYCLAEAYWHASGGLNSPLDIYCLSWSDVDPEYSGTHWYLRCTRREAWVDLGIESKSDGVTIPFSTGRRRAFITGYEPSNRTQRILNALDL